MIVKLRRKNARYQDLTAGASYVVIGIEAGDFRILNDQGRPYLYPARLFEIVDRHEPADWITDFGDDHERYAYPPSLSGAGFFEDFFDDEKKAVARFWQVVNQRLASGKFLVRRLPKKSISQARNRKGSRVARQAVT